eukprot:snap_masked-scaffold_59-processed-gene-0.52-mRNA-1 protein AED:1.00 eAED:1.00 QI:0/-1/0/0/-1/1/1/0/72
MYVLEMSMEEVICIDNFLREIDKINLSCQSPNCAEIWPEMDEGYLLGLQRRDLGGIIIGLQKREGNWWEPRR